MSSRITFLLVLISLLLTGCSQGTSDYNTFAKCLTEKGVVMYGTEWCGYCKNQKKLFGASFQLVDYVDCDKDKAACNAAGVSGYPTWVINGKSYPGVQSLDKLSSLSGCGL